MTPVSSAPKASVRWRVLLNTAIVMGGTLLSRVLGLVREAIFASQFGASEAFGAFRATFTILDMLYLVIIGGALGSALIPVFSRLLEEQQPDRAWELANTVLTLAFVIFALIAGIVFVFARPILGFSVALGYVDQPALFDLAVRLMRMMLIQPLLLGLGGIMMALLQSLDRFTLPAIAFNVYNLAIIAAAWLLEPSLGIDALSVGVVGGALLYLLVMLPGVVQAGWRFRPSFNWRMPEVRRVGALLAPRLLGQSALQINIIIMATLIGVIGANVYAANGYAYQLLMLPHGILAISIGTVMFPRLTRLYAAGNIDDLQRSSSQTLRLVLWLATPIAVVLAILNVPIIRLLLYRGQFGDAALLTTSRLLQFYAAGVIGLAGVEIVIRTFYAMEDTRTPVIVGVATIALNALLAWSLITFVQRDERLIALSYSLTNLLEFGVLWWLLRRRFNGAGAEAARRSLVAMAVGALALAAVALAALALSGGVVPGVTLGGAYDPRTDFLILAGWLALVGVIGLGVYVAVAALLRAPEIREVVALVRRRKG